MGAGRAPSPRPGLLSGGPYLANDAQDSEHDGEAVLEPAIHGDLRTPLVRVASSRHHERDDVDRGRDQQRQHGQEHCRNQPCSDRERHELDERDQEHIRRFPRGMPMGDRLVWQEGRNRCDGRADDEEQRRQSLFTRDGADGASKKDS